MPADSRVTAAAWSPLKLVPFGITVTVIAPFEAFLTSSAKCFEVTPTDEVRGSGIDSWIFAFATLAVPPDALSDGVPAPEQPARRAATAVAASAAVIRVLLFILVSFSVEG